MGIWIALLMTLAVVGSVMWVMPSPREKAQTEMRQKAMGLGMKVRLLDQKLATTLFPWLDDFRGFTLYEKYFSIGQQQSRSKFQVLRLSADENIHELDLDHPVRHYLEESGLARSLPLSAEALFLFADGAAVLWREKEGVEAVSDIDACLSSCLQATKLWWPVNDQE